MEAVVRSVYELLTNMPLPHLEFDAVRGLEGVKEATIPILTDSVDKDLRIAVVSGLGNAKKFIANISMSDEKLYDFVEVMACPGGCINGGGQPRSDELQTRLDCIYKLDRDMPIRRSHENPVVKELYKRHLGGSYDTTLKANQSNSTIKSLSHPHQDLSGASRLSCFRNIPALTDGKGRIRGRVGPLQERHDRIGIS